jgi:hypothetical protein
MKFKISSEDEATSTTETSESTSQYNGFDGVVKGEIVAKGKD